MLVTFLFQYFIVTPAIGGVFIAGFMAPRASWLLGLIVGLVAATAYSFLVLNGYIGLAPNAETQTQAQDVVFASYLMSPIVGAFFASTAAWYRRFLYLSNPNRGRGRPGTPTRPDGRTRARNAESEGQRAPLTSKSPCERSTQPAHAGMAELTDTARLIRTSGFGGHIGE